MIPAWGNHLLTSNQPIDLHYRILNKKQNIKKAELKNPF